MATKYTFTVRFLKNFFGPITIAMALAMTACSDDFGEDGFLSIFEDDEEQSTNQTSTSINKNSPNNTPNNQTIAPPVTSTSPANTNEGQNQSITRTLFAEDDGLDDVYGAFASQYALMYEEVSFPDPDNIDDTITIHSPFPISITNECSGVANSCSKKKVKVKTWISGFTDTATITTAINPADSIVLFPNFIFDNNALLSVTSAQKAQRQIEVYALENDQEIQFYSATKPITIHPMQVFGDEILFYLDPIIRYPWYSVWITPMADSITNIVDEVAKKLPPYAPLAPP